MGYDSNPAVTDQQTMGRRPTASAESVPGSAFVHVHGDIYHTFSIGSDLDIELGAGGFNTSYLGSGSKNQGVSSLSLSYSLMNGSFIPSVSVGGSIYRDYLVSSNDADEFFTGFQFVSSFSERIDIVLDGTCHWIGYRENIIMHSGHGGGNEHGLRRGHGGPGPEKSVSRDDILLETGINTIFYLSPRITAMTGAGFARQDSSVKLFSYNQLTVSAGFTIEPVDALIFEAAAVYFHTDYDHSPADQDDSENAWSFNLRLGRQWGNFELYSAFSWEQNVTVAGGDTESRSVTQGGVSWSF